MASELVLQRAYSFVKDWQGKIASGTVGERQNDREFMADFYEVFGISKSVYRQGFEHKLQIEGHQKRIDSLLPHLLLIEMESLGVELVNNPGKGYDQAFSYAYALGDETPKFVLACDFDKFYLKEPGTGQVWETTLAHFVDDIDMFSFMNGYEQQEQQRQAVVNAKAAESISTIYRHVIEAGVQKNAASLLMTRIVFCFFADDTEIFDQKGLFQQFLENQTTEDGSDLLLKIVDLFNLLNTPSNRWIGDRHGFPFINGGLFAWNIAAETTQRGLRFNSDTRRSLIEASHLDWSVISPVIFGSMFEGALYEQKRHDLGAHFTSEKNILKIIDSLFMDELHKAFDDARHKPIAAGQRKKALKALHERIAALKMLDPACGSGNFLIIAYRELRRLEHSIIDELILIERAKSGKDYQVDVFEFETNFKVEVSQFYGLEYQAYAVSIARLGMWLMDHLMNLEASDMFGQMYRRIPLHMGANIVQADSLTSDWFEALNGKAKEVDEERQTLDVNDLDYILGNPPFIGKSEMDKIQKAGMDAAIQGRVKQWKSLDYVAGWYVKALDIMHRNPNIETALVSTNSIVQGEQATILWSYLFDGGVQISFGHQTFKWDNNGAHVFVVIVGFSLKQPERCQLFEYPDISQEPVVKQVKVINEYLLPLIPVRLKSRRKQISGAPKMGWGSKITDGQNLLLTPSERDVLVEHYPITDSWLRPYYSAYDLLRCRYRYVLYLEGVSNHELSSVPPVLARIKRVKEMRLESTDSATRKLADYPSKFQQDHVIEGSFIALPSVSSGNREWIQAVKMSSPAIVANTVYEVIGGDDLFAIIESKLHFLWQATIGGRLKGDFRYTNTLVYNTFVIPELTDEQRGILGASARQIIKIRAKYQALGDTLVDMYIPQLMQPDLRAAHVANDKIVDGIYGLINPTDEQRLTRLLELYAAHRGGK